MLKKDAQQISQSSDSDAGGNRPASDSRKEMSAANHRALDFGFNADEVAFYYALGANNSAVEVMGKDELKVIATELVTQVRKSVTIDWTLRAVTDATHRPGFPSARAKIKLLVKRLLRKHGYTCKKRQSS